MSTPDYHLEPSEAPDWAFSPETGITCPECDALLSGLNWKIEKEVTSIMEEVTAMILVPCGHELSTDVWELTFSGRDRRLGTVIRTPKFQQKEGS